MPIDDHSNIDSPTKRIRALGGETPKEEKSAPSRVADAEQPKQRPTAKREPLEPRPVVKPADTQGDELRRQLRQMEDEMRVKRKQQKGFLGNDKFFSFQTFWSTSLVKLTYFLGFLALNGAFILAIVSGGFSSGPFGVPGVSNFYSQFSDAGSMTFLVLLFVTTWLLLNVGWRVLCELFMIRFRTYESLRSLDQRIQLWELERRKGGGE